VQAEGTDFDCTPAWPENYVPGDGSKRVTLDLLGLRLDEVSYQALDEAYPGLTEALREVVNAGFTPRQIRQYALDREMPAGWARWLEQAARFLEAADG